MINIRMERYAVSFRKQNISGLVFSTSDEWRPKGSFHYVCDVLVLGEFLLTGPVHFHCV